MNPLLQGHSGTTPEASRNVFSINQGTNEDDSQSNPHPEAGLLTSVREDRHDMVTAVQRESVEDRDSNKFLLVDSWEVKRNTIVRRRSRHGQSLKSFKKVYQHWNLKHYGVIMPRFLVNHVMVLAR